MDDSNTLRLKGDPKRQAIAPIKGYTYQFWQSIYKWISLKEDEFLFLEGAEDYDIVGPEGAKTVQVKSTQKSFTLRSKKIIEAINNFWEHKKNNPEKNLEYYFLTTAARGKEQNSPFEGKKGLDYWESCEKPGFDLSPLRKFLLEQKGLSGELREFINQSDDTKFRNYLVRKVKWLTGSRDSKSIEELVTKKVCYYGDKKGIPYTESEKVVPTLLYYVLNVLCRKDDRRLEYIDFIKLFDDTTRTSVPNQYLEFSKQIGTLSALFAPILGEFQPNVIATKIQIGKDFKSLPILFPHKYIKRKNIVCQLSNVLKTNNILVLQGSTGMGKSIFAKLITRENEQEWCWINVRSLTDNEIRDLFYNMAVTLDDQASDLKFIIDDLNFGPKSSIYEYALEGLLFAILSHNGKVIITTQGELPNKIILNLNISSMSLVNVATFNREEIKEFAVLYGCPKGKKLKSWSATIFAKTHGHPQLVHGWIKSLQAKKWPQFQVGDLVKDEDIEIVRSEARKKLRDQLPSEEARILIYKISVLGLPFRRNHAIELGQNIHGVNNPGELFDFLVGPWIERIGNNYFRLSPLLENSASKVWGENQIIETRKEIANTILACGHLTLLEANIILLNGLLSGFGEPISALLLSLLKAPEQHWDKIAHEFWWLITLGTKEGMKVFPSNPSVNNFLRLFQFRIALEVDSIDTAVKIANLWEKEIDYGQPYKIKLLDRMMFVLKTLIHYKVPFPQKVIISRVVEAMHLADEYKKIFKKPFMLDDTSIKYGLAYSLFYFVIVRCRSREDFDELLTTLEEQTKKNRNNLLSLFKIETDPSEVLINNIFLNEVDLPSPQWSDCIDLFKRTIKLASSWNVEALASAAYRMIAIIQDEYLDKSEDALKTVGEAKSNLGNDHLFIENERAIILYNQQKYKDSLEIWESLLLKWPKKTVFLPVYQLPCALDCASKLNDWNKAQEIAIYGEKSAKYYKMPVMAVGFHAEYGLALWKSNKFEEAIKTYAEVLDQLPLLPDPFDNLQTYKLQKLVGHALAWMAQEASDRIQLAEPILGWFSNQSVDAKIKELPLQPTGALWYFLAVLEYKVGSGKSMFTRLEKESVDLNLAFIFYQVEHIRIGHALRNLEIEPLVPQFEKCYRYFEITRQHSKAGFDPFQKTDLQINSDKIDLSVYNQLLCLLILAALVKLVNIDKYSSAPTGKWKTDIKKFHWTNKKIEEFFKLIEIAPEKSVNELSQIMQEKDKELRYVAALNISSRKLMKPVIRLYADFLLVLVLKSFPWIEEISSDLEQLISKNWKQVASNQSFALISPRLSTPAIIDACEDLSTGLKKAARILLAAKNAVQLSIPEEELKIIRELAQ